MVHSSQIHLYRPPTGPDAIYYERAQQNNPDPSWYVFLLKSGFFPFLLMIRSSMVPVLAVGFQDIKKRLEAQELQTTAHKLKLSEIAQDLEEMERKHHLVILMKMKEYQRRQNVIIHKVLQVSFILENIFFLS